MAGKRKSRAAAEAADAPSDDASLAVVAQKPRTDAGDASASALARAAPTAGAVQAFKPGAHQRTSSLDAPIMLLEGHEDAVNCVAFSPDGATVATAGSDKTVLVWNVRGECENFMMLSGHKNAILDLRWTPDGASIVTASPDKTARRFDAETGAQTRRMRGHASHVNACDVAPGAAPLVVTGSDDGSCKLWDLRRRGAAATVRGKHAVCAVAFGPDASSFFSGGLDEVVRRWDARMLGDDSGDSGAGPGPDLELRGHSDTITGLALSPDATHLLSNGMDGVVRRWDVRPFCEGERRSVGEFRGATHDFEKRLLRCAWSGDGARVSAGSACRNVHVWDAATGKVAYKLPGHAGAVVDVAFHPREPVVASAGADRRVYLGELAD